MKEIKDIINGDLIEEKAPDDIEFEKKVVNYIKNYVLNKDNPKVINVFEHILYDDLPLEKCSIDYNERERKLFFVGCRQNYHHHMLISYIRDYIFHPYQN